jgi:tetratricopeptide (TPR) repeat protein
MPGSKSLLFAVLGIAVVWGFALHPILGAIALTISAVIYYRNLKPFFKYYFQRQLSSDLANFAGAEVDPVISHCNRGKFRYQTGNEELAIADFDRAIQLDPSTVEAYYYRGLAKKNLVDLAGAKEDLEQAAKMSYDRADLQLYEQISAHLRSLHDVTI